MKNFSALFNTGLIIFASFVAPICVHAQIQFNEHVVTDEFDGVYDAIMIDLDQDTDIDILGAALLYPQQVSWWENDGNQSFTQYTISIAEQHYSDVDVVDLDGDNDIDVVAAPLLGSLVWWKNDGNQDFSEHFIENGDDGNLSVSVADMNDDEYLDFISVNYGDGRVVWYENDGNMNFNLNVLNGEIPHPRDVETVDLDNDGDFDILVSGEGSTPPNWGEIKWWENDSQGNFTMHLVSDSLFNARSVIGFDLNNDNFIDIIAAGEFGISWWENINNQQFTEHIVTDSLLYAMSVDVADLNNDQFIDIIGTSGSLISHRWWENDGNENFTEYTFGEEHPYGVSINVGDLDSDRDIDILVSLYSEDSIIWWENTSTNYTKEQDKKRFPTSHLTINAYPNPFNTFTTITVNMPIGNLLNLKVFDDQGRFVTKLTNDLYGQGTIEFGFDANNLSSGTYFVEAKIPGMQIITRKTVLIK
ncbi:MAG: FG-GAP-like repeat-containing protein [Candidatus Electryonea clarkiae]|nr:FG-GAP-like repeat-containing protein [Candidatus Electryonea clarkiae]MDP8288212.1 FG-GAP-like repeat-containing protein [Candidatus Electryonea clarkiae]